MISPYQQPELFMHAHAEKHLNCYFCHGSTISKQETSHIPLSGNNRRLAGNLLICHMRVVLICFIIKNLLKTRMPVDEFQS
jgi:hypothetical protein